MTPIRKCVLTKVDTNNTKMQTVQVHGIAGEVSSGVERYQQYGFSTYPVAISPDGKGAEGILTGVYGSSVAVLLALEERRFRPTVGREGDVLIYANHDTPNASHEEATQRIALTSDENGNYQIITKCGASTVDLKNNGDITITNGACIITMSADSVYITGNVHITGSVTANGKTIDDTHTHSGVQSGSSATGPVS